MPADGILTLHTRTAGPFTVREIVYPAGLRQPRHAHDYMGVTLVLAGSIRESAGSREEQGDALSLVVKPAGVEHADEVGGRGARTLQIAFDAGVADSFDVATGLDAWRWQHADAGTASMLALLRLTRACAVPADLEEGVVDALAGLASRGRRMREPPEWLQQVKQALDDAAEHATVRALARDAGVHEVSLSRAFRACFGCTLSEYRRRVRVRRAAVAVATGTGNLSRVAYLSGYADHAHFSRDFRRATGLAPSAYRGLVHAG